MSGGRARTAGHTVGTAVLWMIADAGTIGMAGAWAASGRGLWSAVDANRISNR
jgi:hypothetical protein